MISVIVPVYKVEQYLDQCVESLVNQTYRDLEIILVDDGSPDNCGAMCDAWAQRDSRIKVIHKENGGLSDARNAGMAVATGEYIGFVDSDDYVASTMYEELHSRILETDSDIASCGVQRVWTDTGKTQVIPQGNQARILERVDAMRALIDCSDLIMTVWNKLYRRSVIREIPFAVGKLNEDEYWSWQAIAAGKRVATIVSPLYHYRQRQGSIMGNIPREQILNVVDAKCQRHQYILRHMPELSNESCWNLLGTCQFQGQLMMRAFPQEQIQEQLRWLKSVTKMHSLDKMYFLGLKVTRKIRYWMIRHCFVALCRLQNALGIGY